MKAKTIAIKNFAKKYAKEKDIAHVVDFLNSVYPYKKQFNFSYPEALGKANAWTEKLNQKKETQLNLGKVKVVKRLGDKFTLVKLLDQTSKDYEGFHMGHCVASYKEHEGIYSVRDPENLPVCTIEITGKRVEQIKGKANGKVAPKYINYCLKALRYFNKNVSSAELENLGYSSEIDIKWVKRHFENYKIIKFNNKSYLYTENKLKLVKPPKKKNKQILKHFTRHDQCPEFMHYLVDNVKITLDWLDKMLASACTNNNLSLVKKLIAAGARVGSNSCLSIAASKGHLDLVKWLIENAPDVSDYPIFHAQFRALEFSKFNVAHYLLTIREPSDNDVALILMQIKTESDPDAKKIKELIASIPKYRHLYEKYC